MINFFSMKKRSPAAFIKTVTDFYKSHGRHDLPWRKTRDPYKILVSEIMLQQTQVDRVIGRYAQFLKRFPTLLSLAKASNAAVLTEWQGLGYNRRALHLKRATEVIAKKYKGKFPRTYSELVELPGVGPATAGDLMAFAWNKPALVLETNIRTVYMHHFFPEQEKKRLAAGLPCKINDKELLPILEKTLDTGNPRDWYYALMDYGTFLKKTRGNNISRSAHYTKQTKFKGSNRELRSRILKLVLHTSQTKGALEKALSCSKDLLGKNLSTMQQEGLIHIHGNRVSI